MLGEGDTSGISRSFGAPEKKFIINLSFHYKGDNNHLFDNTEEIYNLKASNKNVNFPTQFCLGSICNKFCAFDSRDVSLKGNVYDLTVDYNSTDKFSILKTNRYLLVKNNIIQCLGYRKNIYRIIN